jgi:tetratricopeptide (TPR) repeat protein
MLRLWVSVVRVARGLTICAVGSLASQTQVPPAFASRIEAVRGLLAAGNYAVAEQSLRRVLVESPSSADAHFLLGFALLHEGKATESLAEYTEGAKFGEPGADDLAAVASDYVLLKDFADADRWLRAALQRAPTRAQLWYLLGRTQYNENRWADAEHSFLECLRLETRHVRAEYNLGLVYEAEQRLIKAEEAYQTAIGWEGVPPEDIQPYLDWGMLLRRQGKIAKALPLLSVAAQDPRAANPLAHQELGLALDSLGRTEEAVAEVKKAVALTPNVEALHFFLGRMYRKMGRRTDATREFAEAARIAGTQTDAGVPNAKVP